MLLYHGPVSNDPSDSHNYRHAIQAVQPTIDPIENPGQNGMPTFLFFLLKKNYDTNVKKKTIPLTPADTLGTGSVQDSQDFATGDHDKPFWDSATANIKNLHAIISGHGKEIS